MSEAFMPPSTSTITISTESYKAMHDLYRRFYQIHSHLERRPCQTGKRTAATLVETHFSGAAAQELIAKAAVAFSGGV